MSKRKELEVRQSQQQRKQWIQIIVIIAVLAVVIIGGVAIVSRNQTTSSSINAALPAPKAVTRELPANAEPNGAAFGPANAPIKIIEFIDYQCPACQAQWSANESAILTALSKSGKVRYEVHPLTFLETRAGTTESTDAATAALCAADQGKFWDMHNSIYGNQYDENVGQFSKERLKLMAAGIGLDAASFATCLDSGAKADQLKVISDDANRLNVQSTPSFVINDKVFTGGQSIDELKKNIASAIPGATID
ncbi:MAG: thioredoxin domain-containing protein [Chloroflexi bacterium]|nr:thioredoxin domain-containing protein [Chloroflexota bacterium]